MEFISAIELIKIQQFFFLNVDFTRMSKVRNALLLFQNARACSGK